MILSEFAGAAQSLNGSLIINPCKSNLDDQKSTRVSPQLGIATHSIDDGQRATGDANFTFNRGLAIYCRCDPYRFDHVGGAKGGELAKALRGELHSSPHPLLSSSSGWKGLITGS